MRGKRLGGCAPVFPILHGSSKTKFMREMILIEPEFEFDTDKLDGWEDLGTFEGYRRFHRPIFLDRNGNIAYEYRTEPVN